MTVTIPILLLSLLCFDGGLSGARCPARFVPSGAGAGSSGATVNNRTFPRPMLDLIKLYAKHVAWFMQNHYDRYPDHKDYDKEQCQNCHRELQAFVPTHMNSNDLRALLKFIERASEATGLERDRGPTDLHQQMIEAKSEFRNSTFGPSEYMIDHIQKLAEHSAWVALNDRARYYSHKESDERKIEDAYQKLLENNHSYRTRFEVYCNKYQIEFGAVHVGIEVNEREYFFDGNPNYTGVQWCIPKTWAGRNATTEPLGSTDKTQEEIDNIISNLSRYHYTPNGSGYPDTRYSLASHNCQHFASDLANRLGVDNIPLNWRQAEIIEKTFTICTIS